MLNTVPLLRYDEGKTGRTATMHARENTLKDNIRRETSAEGKLLYPVMEPLLSAYDVNATAAESVLFPFEH